MEEILNVLSSVFKKCDEEGNGVVETNKLISQLTSQDPAWQEDELIKEEFHKLLQVNETNGTHFITKEDFINSLLHWFQEYCERQAINNIVGISGENEGQDRLSSSSSGIEGSSEMIYKSSASSMEDDLITVYYVSGSPRLPRKDNIPEDLSMSESESPVSNDRIRALELEVNLLQQRNDVLECTNSTLVSQVSCLEDDMSKYKSECAAYAERLSSNNDILQSYKSKLGETEEQLSCINEENKTKTMKLVQLKRETTTLKGVISRLENQIYNVTHEKMVQNSKIHDLKERLETLHSSNIVSAEKLEESKLKEMGVKDSLDKAVRDNKKVKDQLELSIQQIRVLKSELTSVKKELSNLQNKKVQSRVSDVRIDDDLSADNSMVFFDDNFTLDDTIPLETSLFAELNDKAEPFKEECVCMKRGVWNLSSSSVATSTDINTRDASVGTDEKILQSCSTMVDFKEFESKSLPACKDVEIQCSIKNLEDAENKINGSVCQYCHLKTKRSVTRWMVFAIVTLLFAYALGFFSPFATSFLKFKRSPHPICLIFRRTINPLLTNPLV